MSSGRLEDASISIAMPEARRLHHQLSTIHSLGYGPCRSLRADLEPC